MSGYEIEVVAASRLHFGMFSFGQPDARQFGGVGAMVDHGSLRLRLEGAERFAVSGPLAARAALAVERIAANLGLGGLPRCRVEIDKAPCEHVGLGTGTQLALALAAGINAFCGGGPLEPLQLATLAGRGARSAIGTYGFARGGLLVDGGKLGEEPLAQLEARVELPPGWRFVLIGLEDERGLSGEDEQRAFRDLPPVPPETTRRLRGEVSVELLPAAKAGDFERFGESLFRFGRDAGMCFAARQGGPFAGPRVAELVRLVRTLGAGGCGQSSWGPTVFALLEDEAAALRFQELMTARSSGRARVVVVGPCNVGASVTRRNA